MAGLQASPSLTDAAGAGAAVEATDPSALDASKAAALGEGARKAITEPVVTGYRPAVPLPGDSVRVRGRNLLAGNDAGPFPLRINGAGYARKLAVLDRRSGEARVRLPGDIPPGRYFIGLFDDTRRDPFAPDSGWRSNTDRYLEVGRRVSVRVVLHVHCYLELDDKHIRPGLAFTPRGGETVTAGLRFARTEESDAIGKRLHHYVGEVVFPWARSTSRPARAGSRCRAGIPAASRPSNRSITTPSGVRSAAGSRRTGPTSSRSGARGCSRCRHASGSGPTPAGSVSRSAPTISIASPPRCRRTRRCRHPRRWMNESREGGADRARDGRT